MSTSFNIGPYCDDLKSGRRMILIKTDRLMLEPLVEAHAPELSKVFSDPGVSAFVGAGSLSVEGLRAQIRKQAELVAQGNVLGRLGWAIRLLTGELVGSVDSRVLADATSLTSCLLASRHRRKGYAKEAVNSVMQELAVQYQVRTFYAVIKKNNQEGYRLLKRLGYVPARSGDHHMAFILDDEVLFSRSSASLAG